MVGDVMYDSLLYNIKLAEKNSNILEKLKLKSKGYALATVHRAENTDNPEKLNPIFIALSKIAQDGLPVIIPLHPRTRKNLNNSGAYQLNSLIIIDPVSYLDMLLLEKQSKVILTDSGGVQKEAYWLEVPCVTLRNETEWVETLESEWNVLVGSEPSHIIKATEKSRLRLKIKDIYGEGKAADQIILILSSFRP